MNREQAATLLSNIEFVKAFAEGKAVQFRVKGSKRWSEVSSPDFQTRNMEYRIKPEPKQMYIVVHPDGRRFSSYDTDEYGKRESACDARILGGRVLLMQEIEEVNINE